MQILGHFFPGINDPELGRSQRSYSYDPVDSLSTQATNEPEVITPTTDNITYLTPFIHASGHPATPSPGADPDPTLGNVSLFKHLHQSHPGWFSAWFSNDWNSVRAMGVAYGVYAPHLPPQQALPVQKLYEPGAGFVLPATFLGQPLVPQSKPPGA